MKKYLNIYTKLAFMFILLGITSVVNSKGDGITFLNKVYADVPPTTKNCSNPLHTKVYVNTQFGTRIVSTIPAEGIYSPTAPYTGGTTGTSAGTTIDVPGYGPVFIPFYLSLPSFLLDYKPDTALAASGYTTLAYPVFVGDWDYTLSNDGLEHDSDFAGGEYYCGEQATPPVWC